MSREKGKRVLGYKQWPNNSNRINTFTETVIYVEMVLDLFLSQFISLYSKRACYYNTATLTVIAPS